MEIAEPIITKFVYAGFDTAGRQTFTSTTSTGLFVDVEGILYTTDKAGEPLFSLRMKTPKQESCNAGS